MGKLSWNETNKLKLSFGTSRSLKLGQRSKCLCFLYRYCFGPFFLIDILFASIVNKRKGVKGTVRASETEEQLKPNSNATSPDSATRGSALKEHRFHKEIFCGKRPAIRSSRSRHPRGSMPQAAFHQRTLPSVSIFTLSDRSH